MFYIRSKLTGEVEQLGDGDNVRDMEEPVVVIHADQWRELAKLVASLEGFCCDGVVAWSLLTKDRLDKVQVQMELARAIIASVEAPHV